MTDLIQDRDRFAATHPEMRVILNGRDWGMVAAGTGPALLLIPGTLGRADIFWQQIEALKDRARVIAVSYPAEGGVADWSADLLELMDGMGIDTPVILGSSLGGYVAQYIAAQQPERVCCLIAANTLSDASGIAERPPYSSDLDAAPIDELRAGFGRGLGAWAEAHPDQQGLVDLLMREVGGRITEPELRARLKALKDAPALPDCPLPPEQVTTVEAEDDPLIPPPMREAVRAALRPGQAWRFGWGGHFPYVVRPAEYTAILEQALGLAPARPGERTL